MIREYNRLVIFSPPLWQTIPLGSPVPVRLAPN
jgi:hypothetical protein